MRSTNKVGYFTPEVTISGKSLFRENFLELRPVVVVMEEDLVRIWDEVVDFVLAVLNRGWLEKTEWWRVLFHLSVVSFKRVNHMVCK